MAYAPRKPNTVFDVYGARRKLGMTQAELAERIDCNPKSIRRWERHNMTPQRYYINRIKRLLEQKFGGMPDVPPPVQSVSRRAPKPDTSVDRPIDIMPGL